MNNLAFAPIIAAIVSIGSYISIATGHAALGAVFADPSTATALTAVVGGVAALISAFMPALHKAEKK